MVPLLPFRRSCSTNVRRVDSGVKPTKCLHVRSPGHGRAEYSRRDHAIAEKLRELLENEGWDVWWDHDLYAGATWEEMLLDELARCKAVVVLWSQHAVKSGRVLQEARIRHCLRESSCLAPSFRLPRRYWKVVIWRGGRLLQSACFDVPNSDDPARPQRRSLREIEDLTGLEFSPSVHEATPAAQVPVALA